MLSETVTIIINETDETQMNELTADQQRAIKWLRGKFAPRTKYEFKTNEIELFKFDVGRKIVKVVYLRIETGLIEDEGTLAAFFGREYRWFEIGKRGAVKVFNRKTQKWSKDLYNRSRE